MAAYCVFGQEDMKQYVFTLVLRRPHYLFVLLCAVQVNDVVFSPDESHFATCSEDGSVRVWSVPSIELVVQFQVLNQVGGIHKGLKLTCVLIAFV